MPIDAVLVANRGEIALRIMRTVRELGLRCIAVHSTADAGAPHVRFADDAVCIGEGPARDSYLRSEAIIDAARRTGADAIHPGYGFLSENAGFARAVEAAGLIFIGPPAAAIEIMGDKAVAKRAMLAAAVPVIPGYQAGSQSIERLRTESLAIGFPLMVKAAAGGGGRGMRRVADASALDEALAHARSEAENAFGNGELILEQAITAARHVEIQIFADRHGNTIHLGERDCSIQRRHQKVLEESPCPVMTGPLRAQMGAAAVAAARAVDYVGAGTVEFLLDDSGAFWFLEMNTRLQVEHPVTELVTGLDLVALQIAVAQGAPLPITQADLRLDGHAIEARLYAEDPAAGFLPSTGTVSLWLPPTGAGIRVDAGIETGAEISPFYDPMVAKIIAHGATRTQARQRLIAALARTALVGVAHNRAFLMALLADPEFAAGRATTDTLDHDWPDGHDAGAADAVDLAAAAVVESLESRDAARSAALEVPDELLGWSSSPAAPRPRRYGDVELTVQQHDSRDFSVGVEDREIRVSVAQWQPPLAVLAIDGEPRPLAWCRADGALHVVLADGRQFALRDRTGVPVAMVNEGTDDEVRAPMHGVLVELGPAVGERVAAGDTLAVLEAMKMQHAIRAPMAGTVARIETRVGDQLAAGALILTLEPVADA